MLKKSIITILLSSLLLVSYSQKRIITGKVTNKGNEPLSGVYVKTESVSNVFTLTDGSGNYKIEVPKEAESLVFSFTNMKTLKVEISGSDTINASLTPDNYRKIRFGGGLSFGSGSLSLSTNKETSGIDTTASISMTPISISLGVSYRINRHFEVLLTLEDDLNLLSYIDDKGIEQSGAVNRIIFTPTVNYIFPLSEKENHHVFAGLALQFQNFTFIQATTVGLRINAGISLFNYGTKINPRIFLAVDIAGGKVGNEQQLPNLIDFSYSSFRLGVMFLF